MQKELRYISRWSLVVGLWILGIGLLTFPGCAKHESRQREQAPIRVKTVVVAPHEGSAMTRYVGTVAPLHETPLSMQTSGRVLEIRCRESERVHQGQLLVRVDDTQARNALQTAEAALRQAQDGYDRVRQVHEKGAVTDQKMVEIESQLARARSLRDAAQQQVNECTLIAPCDGVVSGLNLEAGQTIIPGMKLFSLLDVTALNVRFTVPEAEIGKIVISRQSSETSGEIECVALDTVLPIRITEKSMTASPLTHTYEVTARIIGGTDILLPGMIGKVKLKGERGMVKGERTEEDIVIPAHCVLLKPEGPTVWVVENGRAVRRNIKIDGYLANGVRVKSGLQEGDSLITEGYQKLYISCKVIED